MNDIFEPENEKEFIAKAVAGGLTPHYLHVSNRDRIRKKGEKLGFTIPMIKWLLDRWDIKQSKTKKVKNNAINN